MKPFLQRIGKAKRDKLRKAMRKLKKRFCTRYFNATEIKQTYHEWIRLPEDEKELLCPDEALLLDAVMQMEHGCSVGYGYVRNPNDGVTNFTTIARTALMLREQRKDK